MLLRRRHASHVCAHNDGLSAFLSVRPRLLAIAHRLLGSAVDAEDIVQDAWLRWQLADRTAVEHVGAFLATTTSRLAINVLHSARARRETRAGRWLDRAGTEVDPRLDAERSQALGSAVRLLLERLTPAERAAYILREAFDYSYRDIAKALRVGEANARQLVTRARQHVVGDRTMPASSADERCLLHAFIVAARSGDVDALEGVLCVYKTGHIRS